MRLSILLVCCATAGCATISAGNAVYALIRGVTLSGVVAIAMLAGCSSVGSVGKIETSTSKKMLATEDVVFGVCGEALEMSTAQIGQLHHAIR